MAFTLGEYQDVFLEEADDQLQELNKNLLDLEQNPDNEETINNIFRAAHSLKSSAAFVGLNDLSELAHKMENLLQGIRDKTMNITPEIIEILFRCFDVINTVIDEVSQGQKPEEDLSGIIAEIISVGTQAKEKTTAAPAAKAPAAAVKTEAPKQNFTPQEKKHLKRGIDQGLLCCEVSVYIEPEAPMKWVKAQLIMNNAKNIGQIVKTVPAEEDLTDEKIGSMFRIVLLSLDGIEGLRKMCNVDLVTRVDIVRITLEQKDGKFVIRYGEPDIFREEGEAAPAEEPAVEAPAPAPVAASAETADHDEEHDEDADVRTVARKGASADKKGGTNAPTLRTVKVSVDKLDELLNTVGELVISNSGFYRLYEDLKSLNAGKNVTNEFKNRMEQMSRIAKDLQSGIMKTRMVPIGQVFTRFNRLVRDLAKDCGKQVQLVTKGEDTELDKKVIDVIGEPLMHLVRNSIDHGIEMPDERLRQKKPELGTVTLDAYQAGNQILVEVSDDGRGLNTAKIRKKALEQGLATAEILANMDDNDIFEFIFHPGFSTADTITEVSGRGVGMNVVREVVNEMNGNITIESEPGMGTRFVMSFPLTLAIIPAIMVKVRKEMYAVPLSDVIETIKISSTDITTIEGHEVINLRGEILSLLRLNQFVGIESGLRDQTKIPVVVVGYGNRKIGLIVDELEGKQEIVIKSLEQNYTTVSGLAGASILGDGSICLILDISSMISRVISEQEKLSREQRSRVLDREASVEKFIESKAQQKTPVTASSPVTPERAAPKPVIIEKTESKPAAPIKKEEPKIPAPKAEAPKPAAAVPSPAVEAPRPAPAFIEPVKSAIASAPVSMSESSPVPEVSSFVESVANAVVPEGETTPVAEAKGLVVDDKVREALDTFKNELETNISNSVGGKPDDHIKRSLSISDTDLRKIQVLANVGITHGAESLSRIINKRVDLAIPEVKLLPIEKIPDILGSRTESCIGVYMPLTGDMTGTVLLSLPEVSGFELLDGLFGLETGQTKELSEDGESALKEITNIVGSSVVNAISEKTGLGILPDVPVIKRDFLEAIIDSILGAYNIRNDYALIMDTEFYYQDDRVMGNLLILPDTASLKGLVEHLGQN